MDKIQLTEQKWMGKNISPLIIAEIGNNHNGDLNIAFELIKIAKNVGVDAVKFQVKNIEKSFPKKLLDSPYTNENSFGNTYREHKLALEFSEEELMVQNTARDFSENEIMPIIEEYYEKGKFPTHLIPKFGEFSIGIS